MSEPSDAPPRERRRGCAAFAAGCLGTIGLILIGFAAWFGARGTYNPRIPPPPPLPNPNAFADYVTAGSLLKQTGGTGGAFGPGGLTNFAAEQAIVARNRPALATLRKGLGERCQIPSSRSHNVTYPYLAEFRNIGRMLAAEADVRSASGDHAGAVDSAMDAIHFGQEIDRGGNVIHALVSIAVQSIAQRPISDEVDKLSGAEANRSAARLESILQTRVPLDAVLREERNSILSGLASLKPADAADLLSPSNPEGPSARSQLVRQASGLYWHAVRDQTLRELERYCDQQIVESAKPVSRQRPVEPATGPVASMLAPVFSNSTHMFPETDARNRIILCVLAIRAYRLAHGRLPAALTDLRLNPALLEDPFSGKSLIYKPAAGDYLLYSVGQNLVDDGGIPIDMDYMGRYPPPGDIGIRRYRSNSSGGGNPYSQPVPHMKAPKVRVATPRRQ